MALAARRVVCNTNLLLDYDVAALLEQWGRWSCSGVGTGGFSTPVYNNDHWVSDDQALWIERSVAQLGFCDDRKKAAGYKLVDRKCAIFLYYRERYNIPMVANALKVGETKASVILRSAEAWIEGYLTMPLVVV